VWRSRPPYPKTLKGFHEAFHGEAECEAYLFVLKHPNGFACPHCGAKKAYSHPKRLVECAGCGRQISLTAGTIMHGSHTPLLTWFYGAFLATTLTPGISAVQFRKQLGLNRYETAFQILHKIRAAMVDPTRGKLAGPVEVDETMVGGIKKLAVGGRGGRNTEAGQTVVVGAVEVREKGNGRHFAGRLRLRAIPDAGGNELESFVSDFIEPDSEVRTDGWRGYWNLAKNCRVRHLKVTQGVPENAAKILPLIHREFSNLKTWLDGTHHGRVERQHIQAYLNEFVFRHNRRFWPFTAFQTVLRLGMDQRAPTYQQLYAATGVGRGVHRSES
jgi:hypothetical protein